MWIFCEEKQCANNEKDFSLSWLAKRTANRTNSPRICCMKTYGSDCVRAINSPSRLYGPCQLYDRK